MINQLLPRAELQGFPSRSLDFPFCLFQEQSLVAAAWFRITIQAASARRGARHLPPVFFKITNELPFHKSTMGASFPQWHQRWSCDGGLRSKVQSVLIGHRLSAFYTNMPEEELMIVCWRRSEHVTSSYFTGTFSFRLQIWLFVFWNKDLMCCESGCTFNFAFMQLLLQLLWSLGSAALRLLLLTSS